jgi:hypothetical protein
MTRGRVEVRGAGGALALALVLAAQAGQAQERAGAIAFAQAVELSGGVGTGATLEEAVAAARAACVAGGAAEADCLISAACQPAGWSIDVFVQHREGPHWHEFTCGIADQAMVAGIAEAVCDREARPWLMECAVVEVRDPSGSLVQ